ncbi:MAG: 50S ribosomal protein L15 [Mycoplasma sp.]
MELHNLKYTKGARGHKVRTYGRGFSSGLGKTSGKGTKGQKSRKSGHVRIGFEGGQTPIYRKIPKVGFSTFNFRKNFYVINVNQIVKTKLTKINRETLLAKKMIGKQAYPIKLIGGNSKNQSINHNWEIEVNAISAKLKEQLEKAKVKLTIVPFSTKTNKK